MSQPTSPQPLDNPETPDREWVARGLAQLGKLQIADRARRMADNQHTLDTSNAADRARRELAHRIEEWNFERVKSNSSGGGGSAAGAPETSGLKFPDEEMQINIDSPTTINYGSPDPSTGQPSMPAKPAPQPPAAAAGMSKLALAGLLAAASAGGAVPAGVAAYMMRPAAQATVEAAKNFGLDLLPPDKSTPEK